MEAAGLPSKITNTSTSERDGAALSSAPMITPDGVLFALDAPDAHLVQLVGDFNGWTLDGNEMTPTGTVWTCLLKLQPGRYRYRYVIDGEWRSNPLNMEVEPSPYRRAQFRAGRRQFSGRVALCHLMLAGLVSRFTRT